MDIAKILKERRLANDISQHDLAVYCNFTHRANISKLEARKLEWKWRDVIKACELLKLKIAIKEASNE